MRTIFVVLFLLTLFVAIAPANAASLSYCRNVCQPTCTKYCGQIFSKRRDPDNYYACIGACVDKCVESCSDD